MFWFLPILIGIGVAAIVGLAIITIKAIRKWITEHRRHIDGEKVELIKQKLKNGEYKVVTGVYKRKALIFKDYSGKTFFEGKKLDSDLEDEFGNKKRIVMDVEDF
jgi:hypothetical protein